MTREDIEKELGRLFAEFTKQNDARFDALEKAAGRIGATRGLGDEVAGEYRKSLAEFARTGDPALAAKTMSIGSDPDGGHSVAPEFDNAINQVVVGFSPMRKIARVVKAKTGQWQTLVATSDVAAQIVEETTVRGDSATPAFEKVVPPGGALSAIAPITSWLLEDSEYDLASFIIDSIGRGFGVAEGAQWITGTGLAGQAKGLLSGAAPTNQADSVRPFGTLQFVSTGQAATLGTSLDPLIAAAYALRAGYRGKASWIMHSSTLEVIRKLKDSQLRNLWEPSNQAGEPPRLLGMPAYEDPFMPVIAANAFPIAVGDFSAGYTIVDAGKPRLIRDELTSKGTTKIYYERRAHGSPVDTNAIKLVKVAV